MNGENDTMYYVHKDYLGSYDVITDEHGNVLERLSFDPWGRRRNPDDWTFNNMPANHLFDRGYTGHEHLDVFSLINMNGRVYDPFLGRFLSPDPFVQSPTYSQSHNRYSYCFNNPLKFSDPSGYSVWKFEDNPYRPGGGGNPNGALGYMGPGSGYHWSDGLRSIEGNFNIMSESRFVRMYSRKEYNKQLFNNAVKTLTGKAADFPGSISYGLNAYGQWQMIAVTSTDGEKYYTPYFDDENIQMMTIFLDNAGEVANGGGGELLGNIERLQNTAFGIGLGSGIWGEAARDLGKTTSTVAADIQAAKVIGNIGKVARVGTFVSSTISIGANVYEVYYNPTAGNIGRLSVSVLATCANGLNVVIPGTGTMLSIGISLADAAWGHYLYDGLDNYFSTSP